ncbi:MAG TPA: hydrogenase 4 subunit B [Xanthobacteraceae bacterium]|nr:hydrogenase 4 subunit B [Xanthobacteraceae bacterium]
MNVANHAGAITAAFLALAAAGLPLARSARGPSIFYLLNMLVSIGAAASGAFVLWKGEFSAAALPIGLAETGVSLRLDALSATFAVIVNVAAALASLYAMGYGHEEKEPARVLPFYALFLLGMNLVLVADDAFSFLVAWEFMSLSSWALVVLRHEEEENRRAGALYLVMAFIGALALIFAFGVMAAGGGNYFFGAMRGHALSPLSAAFVLVLVLIGAGSKSGLVPLHAWLPPAHAAAPSHVSALMSGVMTKVAVYGFVRIVFDLMGAPAPWWGMVVLALAGATTVLGVLYALMQHDLKRLLAYHTVENIGIIYIGLGLALAFKAHGFPAAAALSATAAIFHVFNHSVFKSLLFFGAGAVQNASGTRDMENLGGLIRGMPLTALTFLVGCVAISALPPLNGFVSEWLTFQAILLSPDLPEWGLKLLVPAVGALLALSAALAAACFVKAFGIVFLGRPRTRAAREAHDADRFSLAAMFALAALCIAAGIFSGFFIDALAPAISEIADARMPVQTSQPWLTLVPVAESRSSYNGLLVFLFIVFNGFFAAFVIHALASNKVRRGPAWDCGFPDQSVATQYSASSFAQPIRRVFGTVVFRASEHVEMPPPGSLKAAHFEAAIHDPIWDALYAPVIGLVAHAAEKLNRLQFLTIRRYLSFVFLALILLLLVLLLWP